VSEMLANRYFIARDFAAAAPVFEKVLEKDPRNERARKKLVICHTQTGNLDRAIELLLETLREAPRSIIDTHPQEEDCPCPELTGTLWRRFPYELNQLDTMVKLGILELYCNLARSMNFWRQLVELEPNEPRFVQILELLEKEEPSCHS
jgi:tetratricopeptide (TPR) repeat protein